MAASAPSLRRKCLSTYINVIEDDEGTSKRCEAFCPKTVYEQVCEEPVAPNRGINFPSLVDLRQVTILPKAEWQRIEDVVSGVDCEAEFNRAQREEREELHKRSKEVIKHWSNTIAGHRQKKLAARKIREEKEEEERVRVDIEEAKYMAQKRKQEIERAKVMYYHQTDRVKQFHSAFLLTEVMKEREAQIDLKRKKLNILKGQERVAVEEMHRMLEKGAYNEQEKMEKQMEARKGLADFHLEQIREHDNEKQQDRKENIMEGEEIKKLARLHEWERDKLEALKKQEKYNNMVSHLAHLENMNIFKTIQKQKELDKDEEIRAFVSAKQKMLKYRKKKQAEDNKQIEEHRNRMLEVLGKQLKDKIEDEDDRIKRATAEMEAKSEKEIREKEEKRMADLKSIAEHRIMMLKAKEDQEKEERIEGLEILHAKKEAYRIFGMKKAEKQQKILEECKKLQSFQIQQLAEKKARISHDRNTDLDLEKHTNALLALEEKKFQEYAKRVIDSATENGRNTYPLLKAAHCGIGGGYGPAFEGKGGIKPSYQSQDKSGVQLPKYTRGTTEQIKHLHDTGDIQWSKQALGFMW
ncbi:coiled-coil domain-containing protein 173 isoform X2 [Callorhinchus milii]|uniref:Cilia and flagella associated protein 210 n=1 Tax=Callorhinchus milii TaxID=7868 RepID=V9KQ27_CALMI|nr:coiled-coil domain-containing protein 173 isoform X2 [Callorhinchus milii]